MKRSHLWGICLLLCSILCTSCEKEPDTDFGVIGKNLKAVIAKNNVTTCTVIVGDQRDWTSPYKNVAFEIKYGFLIITDNESKSHQYNLQYLSNYDVYGTWIRFYFPAAHP